MATILAKVLLLKCKFEQSLLQTERISKDLPHEQRGKHRKDVLLNDNTTQTFLNVSKQV